MQRVDGSTCGLLDVVGDLVAKFTIAFELIAEDITIAGHQRAVFNTIANRNTALATCVDNTSLLSGSVGNRRMVCPAISS